MPDADPAQFITAMSFAVSALLMVVILYAVHVVISNKHLTLARDKLKALTVRLSTSQEQQRRRIAEELHDQIGETLVVSSQSIEKLKSELAPSAENRHLEELSQTIQKFMQGAKSLIFELIPPALYDLGLEAAVESFAAHCKRQYKISVRVEESGPSKRLAPEVAVFLYNAIRELVLNAVKHADADAVTIKLSREPSKYKVLVEDNGVGFNATQPGASKTDLNGFGLFNIQVQAEHYGGHLDIADLRSGGAGVSVWVTFERGEHADQDTAG